MALTKKEKEELADSVKNTTRLVNKALKPAKKPAPNTTTKQAAAVKPKAKKK